MNISIDIEKKNDSTPTHDKNFQQKRNRRELPQPDKRHLRKLLELTSYLTVID